MLINLVYSKSDSDQLIITNNAAQPFNSCFEIASAVDAVKDVPHVGHVGGVVYVGVGGVETLLALIPMA